MNIDQILSTAEDPAYHRVATVGVLLRQDLIARHEELEAELEAAQVEDAREHRDPGDMRSVAIAQQIEDLQSEMESAKTTFRFRAVGQRAWADLLAAHPPTRDQIKAAKDLDGGIDHNPDTFPAAALAASCVEPEMSQEQAARLEQALNHAQFRVIWAACLDANLGGLNVPKSTAAGVTLRVSGKSGITAALVESLAASSLAE